MLTGQSVFCQCLQSIEPQKFAKIVENHQTDYRTKKFSSYEHLISMLFLQFSQSKSLREIDYGLRSIEKKISHIGLKKSPNKSTLSYANKHRSYKVFKEYFYQLLGKFQNEKNLFSKHRFKFKNRLMSIDASNISVSIKMFDWAQYRTHKGAVKLHLMLDHDGCLPVFADLTEGKKHEINIAREMMFPKGAIIAMDRGYSDYNFFKKLSSDGVYFVGHF